MEVKSMASPNPTRSPQQFTRSPQRSLGSPSRPLGSPQMRSLGSPQQRPLGSPQRPAQRVVITSGQTVQVLVQENSQMQQQQEVVDELVQEVNLVTEEQQANAMGQNSIQIIDENGQKIVILNSGQGELGALGTDESDMDTDAEDREFTVIVEEDEEELEEGGSGNNRDIHIDENNVIEAESIEDILAQFESESAPRSVACPNCRKCFVSAHFLNRHISNPSTMR